MNRDQLAKTVGRRVRLRPPAMTSSGERLDDDWRIAEVTDTRVELRRVPDDAPLRLGLDHIHRYASDPDRDDQPDAPYGFLVLIEKVIRRDDGRFTVEIVIPGDAERRMASLPPYTPEVLEEVRRQYEALDKVLREAVRHLLLVGEMTDAQMARHLSEKKVAHGAPAILQGLSNQTTLVQRVLPDQQQGERATGYRGPYKINPVFKDALRDIVAEIR